MEVEWAEAQKASVEATLAGLLAEQSANNSRFRARLAERRQAVEKAQDTNTRCSELAEATLRLCCRFALVDPEGRQADLTHCGEKLNKRRRHWHRLRKSKMNATRRCAVCTREHCSLLDQHKQYWRASSNYDKVKTSGRAKANRDRVLRRRLF
jgi:hypothetical protein